MRLICTVAVLILVHGPNFALASERALKVPPGYAIQLVAAPPLVNFPVSADFDDQGRLYVTDMAGPITREEVGAQKPAHRIVRLEDTNGDGTFDRAVTFAEEIPFPEGAMWLDGSLYVAAPPNIWKFTDTNNDGKADQRSVWFDGQTITGCANDLHGPFRGPDGYIYWCKGAFAKQEHTLANRGPMSTRASHIFRAKPDGSGLEIVMTGGMDNPVDIAFTPTGERIFTTTFFQHPAAGKRDGLIHAIYGGIYGKDHEPIHEPQHRWTSPELMPVLTHMGPAAPCGLHRYTRAQLGAELRDNIFACQFNLRMVSRHVLKPSGSTYTTEDSPFVTSEDMDFHPTDVFEDRDGSLLVIDTGGWYKLCCPSSQLVKADVTGGIYRVRKVGATHAPSDPRPAPLPRLYTIALHRDASGFQEAIAGLTAKDLHTRRLAAEALGRIGKPEAIPQILQALAQDDNDRGVDHALTYALMEIGNTPATRSGLTAASPRIQRATLAALQTLKDGLAATDVLPHLAASDEALRDTAWWIAGKHPDWGGALAGYFRERLQARLSEEDQTELSQRLARFATDPAISELLVEAVRDPLRAPVALAAMSRSGVKATPAPWHAALTDALRADHPHARQAAQTVRALPWPKEPPAALLMALRNLAQSSPEASTQLTALAALPAGQPLADAAFTRTLTACSPDTDANLRSLAVGILARSALTPAQLQAIVGILPRVGPTDLPLLLDAFAKSRDEAVGLALVQALNQPALRQVMRTDTLKPRLEKYPAAVQAEAAKLYAALDATRAGERERFEAIYKELPPGDVRRGQAVFNSTKASCIACHKIGYVGGLIGPDLTRIGGIRTDRDLLESVLYPSAAMVRGYESVKVTTLDGQDYIGIPKVDTPEELVLTLAADREVRIPRRDIEEIKPSPISVMPAGLDQQLNRQELADLIAFLKASK